MALTKVTYAMIQGAPINPIDYGADPTGTNDSTTAIQNAFNAIDEYGSISFSEGVYKTNGVINVTTDNITVNFDGCTFNVGDTGTSGTLSNGSTGKIGFKFAAQNLNVIGQARFIGQGTIGTTSLAGLVFDNCDNAQVTADIYCEKMAAGRMIFWCDRGVFGTITAKDMNGLQTFEAPPTNTAGTAEVVVGCKFSLFGDAVGYDNFKPVRYLSVALDGSSAAIDNEKCVFGATVAEAASTNTYSTGLAIRSAVDCYFGPVQSETVGTGLIFLQYSGDEAWNVNRNTVASVTGTYPNTAATSDGVVTQETTSTIKAIGSNKVISVSATAAGEFGIRAASGELTILDAAISGGTRCVVGYDCSLNFGRLEVSNSNQEMVAIGQSCNFNADFIDVTTGSVGGVTAAVRYNSAYGTGGIGQIGIQKLKYRFNSTNVDFTYVYLDTVNGAESVQIGHIDGAGSSGQADFAGDVFTINNGRWLSTTTPTAGTYSQGALVWKSNAASGGIPGWVCTTAGTPGTWKAMANLA